MSILVSVIVPVYNSENFIIECLDSIISQDCDSFEVLVSDDYSNDSTPILLSKYANHPYVRLFLQNNNLGITKNCNFLLSKARGRFVSFFAGDDIMIQGKLSKQTSYMMRTPDLSFSYHPAEVFSSDSNKILYVTDQKSGDSIKNISDLIEKMGVEASMSIMARRDMLPEQLFNNKFNYVSDWLMQLELASKGRIGFLPEPLCRYRKYSDNNGKDISLYEQEFDQLLDYIQKKWPDLGDSVLAGRFRYLIGKSFRVDPVERKHILKECLLIKDTLSVRLLYLLSFFPLSRYFFQFFYRNRFLIKAVL